MIGRDLEVEEDQEVQNILKNVRDHVINLLKKEDLHLEEAEDLIVIGLGIAIGGTDIEVQKIRKEKEIIQLLTLPPPGVNPTHLHPTTNQTSRNRKK